MQDDELSLLQKGQRTDAENHARQISEAYTKVRMYAMMILTLYDQPI